MTKIKKQMGFFILVVGLSTLLASCSILKKPEQEKLYFLTAGSVQATPSSSNLPIVVIDRPTANAPFNTNKILVTQSFQEIVPLSGVSWSEAIPQMVQQLLSEYLQNGKFVIPLTRENGGLRSNYMLQTEIRDFQVANWPNNPTVTVVFQVNYIDLENRKLVFSRIFKQQIPLSNNDIATVIEGFQQAMTLALRDIATVIRLLKGFNRL